MIKGKLSENFKIKLLSVLVAFGLWIFVMENIDPIRVESMENVPISEITNIETIYDSGLAIPLDQELAVNIDFRGRRSVLLNYLRTAPEVKATVLNPIAGENRVEISVTAPSDIEYSIEPGVFYLTLEESIVSTRQVEIVHTGTPAQEYSVKDILLDESELVVEGPKSQVEKIVKLQGVVNVEGVKNNYTLRVKVIPVDSKDAEVPGVSIANSNVSVEVKIEQSKDVPIKIRFVDEFGAAVENNSYKTDIQTVTVTGDPSQLQTITEVYTQDILVDDFNQFVDRGFDLAKIDGVKMSVNRVNIQADTELEQEYVFTVPSEEVDLIYTNNADVITQSLPSQIEVRFYASKEYEEALSSEGILLYIDNKDFSETYGIKYKIGYPVRDVEINPNMINTIQGE